MEIPATQMKKEKTETVVSTMLKFELSKRDQKTFISFVSQDTKTGRVFGRREGDQYPKKICVVDSKINHEVIPGVLYRCSMIPMRAKDGYIVTQLEPFRFKATVTTNYIPKALYRVEVRFGNMKYVFDPKDGKKESVRNFAAMRELLAHRTDIKDIHNVLLDFEYQADNILKCLEKDGWYVNRTAQKAKVAKEA